MHLNLLHLDDALLGQPLFLETCENAGAHQIDLREIGPSIRLWATAPQIDDVRCRLRSSMIGLDDKRPLVTWLGSGDFHHVTAVIVELLAEHKPAPVTILHFDNHPDWVAHRNGLHCGSWINHVLAAGLVSRVITLGVTSRDLAWPEFKGAGLNFVASGQLVIIPVDPPRTWVWRTMPAGPAHRMRGSQLIWTDLDQDSGQKQLNAIRDLIETDAVYITIDKDALDSPDAVTNWDQGQLSTDSLLQWVSALTTGRTVVGIDVVGDHSSPEFSGSLVTLALKRSEALFDQPWRSHAREAAAHINQATNLKLLAAFEAHLC